ncbi:hypothetical protein [Streptomyces sp. NBC_01351]
MAAAPGTDRFLITGKLWPNRFQLRRKSELAVGQ